jgi:DNA repair protein RadD
MPIIFGGVASVVNNIHDFGHRDLLLIDEAHLLSPKEGTMYQRVISGLMDINPQLKVIGLTATPYRLGQGMLTDDGLFTDICYDKTNLKGFNELLNAGFLCKLVPPRVETELDVSGVRIGSDGDFKRGELQAAVDKKDITVRALTEMMHYSEDRRSWLIFASGIEHAEHISEILNEWGIPTAAIHSKMSLSRDEAIRDFKSGQLRCVVNNNVLTTGFDHPLIDLIGTLRPTVSPGLHIQMLGRGTRIAPGKENCLVLDFAGNVRNLGPINDPVIPRKKGQRTGTAPIKVCPQCDVLVHASLRICDNCGYEFPKYTKLQSSAGESEIIRSGLPKTEWIMVSGVYYTRHKGKNGKPDSIKTTYQCGLRQFTEYVFPESKGGKFTKWWKERSDAPVPYSVTEFLQLLEYLRKPTQIRVNFSSKYEDVLNYKF